MAAPIDLRNDFDSVSLRRLAKRTRDATQSRRLLALAEVYDGGSRTDASRIGGVGLQIIRNSGVHPMKLSRGASFQAAVEKPSMASGQPSRSWMA